MLGVAPPDMQAAIAQAKAASAERATPASPSVDALGGTLVATSPFAGVSDEALEALRREVNPAPAEPPTGEPQPARSDRPPAPAEQPAARSDRPPVQSEHPPARSERPPAPAPASELGASAPRPLVAPGARRVAPAARRSSSALPLLLLVGAVLLVVLLIGLALRSRGSSEAEPRDAAQPAAPAGAPAP
jgi:hypothetical protein